MRVCTGMQERMFDGEGRVCPRPDDELSAHLRSCGECAAVFRGLGLVDRAFDRLAHAPHPEAPSFAALSARGAAASRRLRRRAGLRKLVPVLVLTLSSLAGALLVGALTLRSQRPRSVGSGDVLEASHGSRSARLPSGARLVLEAGRLSISGRGQEERLRLESGTVSVRVPPLTAGAALSVETSDGDVVAHGTRFRVDRSTEGTRVALTEGKVIIHPRGRGRPDIVLRPGESALIEPIDKYRERQRTSALLALDQGRGDEAAASLAKLLATEPAGAMAGEAHALLGWLRQVRAEPAAAADEYRQALALADRGTELWADNAAAELALLEEKRGAQAGAAAWQAYLSRFPSGLHRSLAASHLSRLRAR